MENRLPELVKVKLQSPINNRLARISRAGCQNEAPANKWHHRGTSSTRILIPINLHPPPFTSLAEYVQNAQTALNCCP